MKLQEVFKEAIRDRAFLFVWAVLLVMALVFTVMLLYRITPSDIQIPVRYSSFGVTNLYTDRWYYLLGFIAAAVISFVAHSMIALKLYAQKGRGLALPFMWLSVGIFVITFFIVFALFRVIV